MQLNWKLRLKNKATAITLAILIITFVYQLLSILDVTPAVTEDKATNIIMLFIDLLSMLGVVTDPTTPGVSDSERAMSYEQLGGAEND